MHHDGTTTSQGTYLNRNVDDGASTDHEPITKELAVLGQIVFSEGLIKADDNGAVTNE